MSKDFTEKNYYEKGSHKYLLYDSDHFANYVFSIIDDGSFPDYDTVVEVGSGMGRFSAPFVNRFPNVFLVEPYTLFADMLRSRFSRNGVNVVEATAEQFFDGFKPGSPMLIVGFHILHHLTIEARELLYAFVKKTGSKCIFVEPNPHNPLILIQLLIEPDLTYREEKQYIILTRKYYTKEFARNGIVMKTYRRICFIPPFVTQALLKRLPRSVIEAFEVFNRITPILSSYQLLVFERKET